jgi:SAM-dependent methyltransferase
MTEYRGTDNLEVMARAINHNNYLVELVRTHAAQGDRILDFGAGIGIFAKRLSDAGYNVSCVEPDPKQAAVIAEAGLSVYGDIDQIPDDSFDYLYTMNVLEHIKDDQEILQRIYSKLKTGGRLLIYVPAFQLLYSTMDSKVGHYRRYTKRSLDKVVRHAGFHILHTRYIDSVGFWVTLMYKLIGNKSGDLNERALIIYDRFLFPWNRVMDKLLGSFLGKNVLLVCIK